VNRIRNGLTHTGKIPALKGLTEEQARRHAGAITTGVVPNIFKLAMGRLLGLDPTQSKGFALHTGIHRDLVTFFASGVWRGWPLEEKSFDGWYSEPSLRGWDSTFDG
jgi:hypothetical protein